MNEFLKMAYDYGVQQAQLDFNVKYADRWSQNIVGFSDLEKFKQQRDAQRAIHDPYNEAFKEYSDKKVEWMDANPAPEREWVEAKSGDGFMASPESMARIKEHWASEDAPAPPSFPLEDYEALGSFYDQIGGEEVAHFMENPVPSMIATESMHAYDMPTGEGYLSREDLLSKLQSGEISSRGWGADDKEADLIKLLQASKHPYYTSTYVG